jgi:hypothetical protein
MRPSVKRGHGAHIDLFRWRQQIKPHTEEPGVQIR